MDNVVPYVHERKQFGQAIGEFQLMQGKLADMYTSLNASRAFTYSVASMCDQGVFDRKSCASVILYTAEQATQMALQGIQSLGGNGYINEYPMGRILRDTPTQTHPPADTWQVPAGGAVAWQPAAQELPLLSTWSSP